MADKARTISYKDWRTAVEAGEAAAAPAVYKQFTASIEPVGDRQVRFTITTSAPDRERDVVDATGIDIGNYLKNPIVLFGHDYRSLPIGRTVHIDRLSDRLVATCEFTTADLNPVGDQVLRMIQAGFLNASSIGFQPKTWQYNEDRKGVDFKECELLEWSVVPVPAHPQALVAASAEGLDVSILKDWAYQTLKSLGDGAETEEGDITAFGDTAKVYITIDGKELAEAVLPTIEAAAEPVAKTEPEPDPEPEAVPERLTLGQAVNIAVNCTEGLAHEGEAALRCAAALAYKDLNESAPFERDPIGWAAYVKAVKRYEKKHGLVPRSISAGLLEDYGFDLEAAELRADQPTVSEVPAEDAPLAEEHAVHCGTMGTLLEQASGCVEKASGYIANVTGKAMHPTDAAHVRGVQAMCKQAMGALQTCSDIASGLLVFPDDTEMAAQAGVEKAGRVLSKANETTLRVAEQAAQQAAESVREVLKSVEEMPREEPAAEGVAETAGIVLVLEKDAPAAEPEFYISLADEPAPEPVLRFAEEREPTLSVDMGELGQSIKTALAEVVANETRAALNALRGRVD